MTIFEYTKSAYLSMKDKPKQERWQYFLDYYKWHALAVILVIVLLIEGVVMIATRKDTILSGMLVDGSESLTSETYLLDLEAYLQINPKKEQVRLQTGISLEAGLENNKIESFQQILAGITTKTTDFITAPENTFTMCAYNTSNMLADLRDHLDAETLSKLEGRLYYVDRSLIEQARENALPTSTVYPSPYAPETMVDPVPVGINISDSEEFCNAYYVSNEDLYLGIAVNITRSEMVLKFLEYLGV